MSSDEVGETEMSDMKSSEKSPIAAAVSAPVMRRHNLSLALRTIWDAGRISRTELARKLNLSKPAITRIVGDLIGAGYLDETSDHTASGRGRPSSYLHLRPGMHYFIGVDFRVDEGPRRTGDPASITATGQKVRAELGWVPQHDDLTEIVRTALDWERYLMRRNR